VNKHTHTKNGTFYLLLSLLLAPHRILDLLSIFYFRAVVMWEKFEKFAIDGKHLIKNADHLRIKRSDHHHQRATKKLFVMITKYLISFEGSCCSSFYSHSLAARFSHIIVD
jgi:hypothetical protein